MLAFDESDDERINQCIKHLTVKRYLTINAFGDVKFIPPPPRQIRDEVAKFSSIDCDHSPCEGSTKDLKMQSLFVIPKPETITQQTDFPRHSYIR